MEVLAERLDTELRLGQAAAVAAELGALCERWPLRERFHEQLMLALYQQGRQADALAVANRLRTRLVEEHGLTVGPGLEALELRILQGDLTLLPDTTPETASDASSPAGRSVRGSAAGRDRVDRELVGRDEDVARICDLVTRVPLVTLVGPGGVGKTALAGVVAAGSVARGDEVVWCSLGGVLGEANVVPALATALGVPQRMGVTMTEGIVQQLQGSAGVLVIDNCEHVVGAAAEVIGNILAECPELRVLATSRERLALPGEHVWPVTGLPVDDSPGGDPRESPAVRLFATRAREADPYFRLDDATAPVVASLCRSLDGNPLALELAAARVRSLPAREIARRLDSRFDVLVGRRGTEDRHSSLRAAVAWSYDLLGARQQKVFRRLGAFAGSFSLDAAESVAALDDLPRREIAPLVLDLVDKSLVTVSPTDPSVRYRLLETMRVFARDMLGDADEVTQANARLVQYFGDELQRLGRELSGPGESDAVALARDSDDTDALVTLLGGVAPFVHFRVSWEASSWFLHAVELIRGTVDADAAHNVVRAAAAWGLWIGGDLDAADAITTEALAVARRDDPGMVKLLAAKAVVAMYRNDEAAIVTTEQALDLARRSRQHWMAAYLLGALAIAHSYRGERDRAEHALDRQSALLDSLDNTSAHAWWLYCRAEVTAATDPDEAIELARDATEAARASDSTLIENVSLITALGVAARCGRSAELIDEFEDVIDRCRRQGAWTHLYVTVHNLIEALAQLGADTAAVTLLHANPDGAATPYGEQADRLDRVRSDISARLDSADYAAAAAFGATLTRDGIARFALDAIDATRRRRADAGWASRRIDRSRGHRRHWPGHPPEPTWSETSSSSGNRREADR